MFDSEILNDYTQALMHELDSSDTVGLDDIAMTIPYNQPREPEMMNEDDVFEDIDENQAKRRITTDNYKIDEEKALCEA